MRRVLDWLSSEKDLTLAIYHGDDLRVYQANVHELLAEFFDIDLLELEKKKDIMVENLRVNF